ncbi:ATP-binding cassette subfamily B protein [Actinoalloteichus hoggarensis]|uniref:Multidrug resistance ABC transporter ATP-binding/permease protein BmrA n=1 Tax=Actinoalloteichus hoggarensis TaxID=1470176 RepID=A0A221W3I6_9PSEU|nr:ABC transporter ATP-binding protein [Actinoalloteichus hoggarensis]ASO20219.1 Multidrug resistance ABC transporter ATP-binding/permease protein BmrA [Actinoalloteichus hoggarensis]MBB5919067.1 ATP-binding cassette subfamily B protein [Actinoalloteichus hoggarensis]
MTASVESSAPRWANLRVLWSFVRPHRRVLVLGTVLGLATTGAGLATPMVTKWLLDGLGAQAPIGPAVGLLAALLVVGSVVGLAQWILLGTLAERIVFDARGSMVRRLLRTRVGELAGRSGGELVTRVTSDTVLLREAAASSIVQLINGVVGLLGALLLMAMLDGILFATTIGALIAVAVLVGLLMPKIAVAQQQAQAAVGRLGGVLEGALRALRTVKASRAEGRETERVLHEATEARRESIRAVRIDAVAWTIAGAGIQLAIMLILAVGGWRVGMGDLAVSSLVAFLLYAFQLMDPVSTLTTTVSQLQSGIAAAARIREIQALELEEAEPRTTDRHAVTPPAADAGRSSPRADVARTDAVLSLHDVTARYAPGAAPALTGVTLDIRRTGHTAVVGPSGAGKTSMFSLILKFLAPESGELRLDGVPFDALSADEVRRRIVYVEQDSPLVPGTLRDNVVYSHPTADDEAVWAALTEVRLADRVRALPDGLDTSVADTTISGGERQRIALARALVSDPGILLLDEATAQLDGITEAAVHEVISRVAAQGAVVTIAHRLSTVIDADRIIVAEAGRVRAQGTHAELLATDELYRDLVAALRIATTVEADRPVGNTPIDAASSDETPRPDGSAALPALPGSVRG